MSFKNLVTQGELQETIVGLDALVSNLDEHVNQSLSKAHGWSIIDSVYLDAGGIYHTDFGTSASVVSIPGIFNTGVNNDGSLAVPGDPDAHWTLVQSASVSHPGPAAYISNPNSSAWATNGPNSQWLSPASNGNQSFSGGTYKYRLTFDLTGLNPSSAVISGVWSSDDNTVSILLNGLITGFHSNATYTQQPQNKFLAYRSVSARRQYAGFCC